MKKEAAGGGAPPNSSDMDDDTIEMNQTPSSSNMPAKSAGYLSKSLSLSTMGVFKESDTFGRKNFDDMKDEIVNAMTISALLLAVILAAPSAVSADSMNVMVQENWLTSSTMQGLQSKSR